MQKMGMCLSIEGFKMKQITVSDPEQAKIDVHNCLKLVENAKKECGDNEFLNTLEEKMRKLVESVDKL